MSNLKAGSTRESHPLKLPRRGKGHLTLAEKRAVLNVFGKVRKNYPEVYVTDIVRAVGITTGVGRASIFRIIREFKNTKTLKEPKIRRRRSKYIDIDDSIKNAIRQIVHDCYFRSKLPKVDKVLAIVNKNKELPQFKRTTFYKLLKSMNFKYIHHRRDRMLIDKEDIIVWRRRYLRAIQKYRQEGRKIYYLGKTWIGTELTKSDTSTSFMNLRNAPCKGMIVYNIGSSDEFVKKGLWISESKKSQNYDEGPSGANFEHWFANVLPYLERNSVIVMDNTPCHCQIVEQIPNSTTNRADIQQWLTEKQIPFDDNLLRAELLDIVGEHKSKYNKYLCDELAQQYNNIVLRLPLYHSELNPIETILTQLKNDVITRNSIVKLSDIRNTVYAITEDEWRECVSYVENSVEPWMWELDNLMELQMEAFFAKFTGDDSEPVE